MTTTDWSTINTDLSTPAVWTQNPLLAAAPAAASTPAPTTATTNNTNATDDLTDPVGDAGDDIDYLDGSDPDSPNGGGDVYLPGIDVTTGIPAPVQLPSRLSIPLRSYFLLQMDTEAQVYRFLFTMLPQIAAQGTANPAANNVGLPHSSGLNIKEFKLPASRPAYQVLGLNTESLQVAGVLEGGEETDMTTAIIDAVDSSFLLCDLLRKARVCTIRMDTSGVHEISYKVLVQDYKWWVSRFNKVYFGLSCIVLDRPVIVPSTTGNGGTWNDYVRNDGMKRGSENTSALDENIWRDVIYLNATEGP